jgi:hypothetical protein
MRRATIVGALAGALAFTPAAAQAERIASDFEPPAFATGAVEGQGGWELLVPSFDPDADVVANDSRAQTLGLGTQSLRYSNAAAANSARQISSPTLAEAAGEAEAVGDSDTRHDVFDASLTFAAFEPGFQDGLSVQVAPDDGHGRRTTALQIKDTADGLQVLALDPVDNGPGNPLTWPSYEPIAAGLSRDAAHTLRIVVEYADGPANDVLTVELDGEQIHTGITWEQYYRNDPEQAIFDNAVPVADSLLFHARPSTDGAVPGLAGAGLLIDDVAVETRSEPEPPAPGPPIVIADPPAPPVPPAPKPPVVEDERPPALRVGGKRGATGTVRQGGFADGKRAVTLGLRCNERCSVRATGRVGLKVNGKRIKLKVVRRTLRPGAKAKIALRLSPAARRAVRRALRNGRVVKAKVVLRVRDSAGNAKLVRRTVRLRA